MYAKNPKQFTWILSVTFTTIPYDGDYHPIFADKEDEAARVPKYLKYLALCLTTYKWQNWDLNILSPLTAEPMPFTTSDIANRFH